MKRYFFRTSFLALSLLQFFFITAQAQLEHFGLPGERINALAIVPANSWPPPPLLAAATDSNGVFLRDLSSPDSLWAPFGLNGKNIKSLCIQHWGTGPLEANRLFAGVRPNIMLGDSTFLYLNLFLADTTWTSADSGLDASLIQEIPAISAVHYFGNSFHGPVFISAGEKLYRSYEPGIQPWEDIWPQPGFALIIVIEIYPPGEIIPGDEIVWIGGQTGFFAPFLAKSSDYGDNWEFYYPDLSGDNACIAIATVADHPEMLYAGMRSAVIKTIDGGQNWIITSLQNTPYYFSGIVANPANPDHVIAGGVSSNGLTALYETHNGGDSWQDLQPPAVAAGVSDMIANVVGNNLVVYISTFGNGVYRYITPLTGIDGQPAPGVVNGFQLFQNYPNPFNPSTTIRFYLPSAAPVHLEIFNIMGQPVGAYRDTPLPAGWHEIQWDGRDNAGREVGSGVYIYRLRAGDFTQSRKMLLIR